MASFDLETFLKVQGNTGTGVLQALGMSYGIPSCMLNLAQGALSLLPSSVLADMQSKIAQGKVKANEVTASIFKKLTLNTGIIEFDTEEGIFKFGSSDGWMGIDNDDSQTSQNLAGLLGAFQYAASVGAQLYSNYTNITNQIDSIKDCLDKFNTVQSFQSGNSATQKAALPPEEAEELFNTIYAGDKAALEQTITFMKKCDEQLVVISRILSERAGDPSLEPRLLDSTELDPFLDKTNFSRYSVDDTQEDISEESEDVFRLTYGPPIADGGQYVLTSDGLYYDSQSGGLDPVFLAISGIVPVGDKWTYDFDPNLGGRGEAVSIESLNKYTDNLFDLDIPDDSVGIQHFYDEDHFLSVLIQQRNKHLYDLSSILYEYIDTYGENSSIVNNHRKVIISDLANHNSKIARRKKQIEVAIKAPQLYGDASGSIFEPGKIPINDFSYLEGYNLNVDLEKQKALVFSQAEVTGIVLPITPTFVASQAKPASMSIEHLNVPTVGKGSILYSPSGSQAGTVLSLTDQIVNSNLFAIYNFLETQTVLPSSLEFYTTNCATTDMYNNAQMVSNNPRNLFFSGLGIPYLEGVVQNKSTDTKAASALGSFLKLPDTSEYRDLTYNPSGFTIECWVHVPNIMDGEVGWLSSTTSSLTKVLIGCENTGAQRGVSSLDHTGSERDLDFLENLRGDQFTRGMLCGFTRDRRITKAGYSLGLSGYSNNNYDNDPASSLSFFVAPTQARDLSSVSFINSDECQDYPTFYSMKVDLSSTNFGNVSSQFVLVNLAVDPEADEVRMYADGSLVATSSVSNVFGVEAGEPPQVPTFKKDNSFEYSSTTVDGPRSLKSGPLLNTFYSPWIVGGGYTDGMYKYGNFMGGDRGGLVSGLRGHIGSLKFYSKALDTREVLQNYKAQKGFFKSILI
mgnify:CR=1 FL=1